MPIPVVPIGICVLVTTAAVIKKKRQPKMNEEQEKIYYAALRTQKNPDSLRELAKAYEKVGLVREGELLRKRAAMQEWPPEKKKERRDIYRKAIRSKNKSAVMQIADLFEADGQTGAAYNLRVYASNLPST